MRREVEGSTTRCDPPLGGQKLEISFTSNVQDIEHVSKLFIQQIMDVELIFDTPEHPKRNLRP